MNYYITFYDGGDYHLSSVLYIGTDPDAGSYRPLTCGHPLGSSNGDVTIQPSWRMGPLSRQAAEEFARLFANRYGFMRMIDGELFSPGSPLQDAASIMGAAKTNKKAISSAENGRKGGRPKKSI